MSNLIGITKEQLDEQREDALASILTLDPYKEAERTSPRRRTDIEKAIFDSWVAKRDRDQPPHRMKLGASDIGHDCARHVYYTFYWAMKRDFGGRLLRLFDRGHREEASIEDDFTRIGVPISTCTPSGRQHAFSDSSKHYRVHLDGLVEVDGRSLVIEMKTMSRASFGKLDKMGGVRYSHPNYYAQMMSQIQIASDELKIDGALFVAVCKDNDDLWVEEVERDPEVEKRTKLRRKAIINGYAPPRLPVSPNAPPCRWCDYKEICQDSRLELVERNCRTCNFSETTGDGMWRCKAQQPFGTVCEHWNLRAGIQS